jgi:alpha-galactosidase
MRTFLLEERMIMPAMRGLRPDRWLHSILLVFFLSFLGAVPAAAQNDLTGYWVLPLPTGDGNFINTYFDLHQSGETITGDIWYRYNKTAIKEGNVRDGKFHIGAYM